MERDTERGMIGAESTRLDEQVVNVAEKQELTYWARAIRIREEELLEIVKRVGPSLTAILREVTLKDIRDRGFTAGDE